MLTIYMASYVDLNVDIHSFKNKPEGNLEASVLLIFNFQIHVLISNSQTQSIINSYSCKTLTLINHVQVRLIWYPNISILSFDPTVKFTKPPHSAITFKGET